MELFAIKTRVLHPPQDNLFEVLDTYLTDVREGDVVVVTSKVVSIHEGRCVPMKGTDLNSLIMEEAERVFHPSGRPRPMSITNHALIGRSGIDESNGEGYYTLLPVDSFASATRIREHLMKRHTLTKLGVVITDSHSLPFRYGALSVALGCAGFEPVVDNIGRPDLFGRKMEFSKTNIVDALAASATLVSGECDEAQPIQLARGIPNLVWTNEDMRDMLFVPYEEDLYKDLYKDFKSPKRDEHP